MDFSSSGRFYTVSLVSHKKGNTLTGRGGLWGYSCTLLLSIWESAPCHYQRLLRCDRALTKGCKLSHYVVLACMAESVGFEPTVPFGITGFQDRPLKPLGQLSKERFAILTHRPKRVKPSFSFFCAASKPSREPSHTHIDQKNNPCYIRWEMTPASIGGG